MRELFRKGKKLMGIVWGIGERKFGHNYKRRIMISECLIKSTIMYGTEVLEWKEQDKIEYSREIYEMGVWSE